MRWLSSIFRPQQRRWMPVTNVDHDTTGMDDLMRLALEDDDLLEEEEEHGSNRGAFCSSADENIPRGRVHCSPLHSGADFEGPVFCHEAPSESGTPTSVSNSSPSSQRHRVPSSLDNSASSDEYESFPKQNERLRCGLRRCLSCGHTCSCALPKTTFPPCRPCLVVLSVLAPLLCIGLCTGMGVYSLLVYKTDKLVIDKSVKSFSIPNHKVYKHFEAMMLARRDNSSLGRYRRDTASLRPSGEKSVVGNLPFRSKRSVSFVKESEKLRETEEALSNANLAFESLTRRKRHIDSASLPSKGLSRDSLSGALHRFKRRTSEVGCWFEYQSVARWKMHVIYLAQGDTDHNMFTKERLQTVHDIERRIMGHPGFHDFCLRDPNIERYDPAVRSMHGCVPLNSLMTYFYPSKDTNGRIFYDGMGSNIDDIDSALTLAMNHETFYYYVDDKINKTNKKSHLIRSEVLFGAPLPGFSCVGGSKDHLQQDEKFKDFVITYIDLLSAVSTDKVHILYGGKEIFDYEVSTTFWSDIRLAIISLIAIFVLMLVLTLSLYLTVVGIVIIALSFPISLFFYRVVFEVNALGILTGAAVFVIIGIGVDDVFVFVNIYRQASHMSNPVSRIIYTVKTAGLATFFTSFTTAAAFAANLASSIPAVYDFGLFMALIVSSCWVSVFILMPPLLYFHACCVEPLETLLFSCFSCMSQRMSQPVTGGCQHETDASPLLVTQEEQVGLYQEEEDVPMLDVGGPDDSPEDQLLSAVDEDYPSGASARTSDDHRYMGNDSITYNNNVCLGRIIQKCVMFLTNRIVLPGRFVILAVFALLLTASCFLMSRLQPATHPPQLFRPDTNLQRLLDLKANFSIIDSLHCDRCSALYKVRPSASHISGEVPPPSTSPTAANVSSGSRPEAGHGDGGLPDGKSPFVPWPQEYWHHQTPPKVSSPSDSDEQALPDDEFGATANKSHSTRLKSFMQGAAKTFEMLTGTSDHKVEEEVAAQQRPDSSSSIERATSIKAPPEHATMAPGLVNDRRNVTNNTHQGVGERPRPKREDIRKTHPEWFRPQTGGSLAENFNVCKYQRCNNLKDRPLMESGTTVYVVFGISGVHRSDEDEGHVMDLFKGRAVFDSKFAEAFNIGQLTVQNVRELCRVCHYLSNMTDLVKEGSAQCLPSSSSMSQLRHFLSTIEECQDLPLSLSIYHHQAPAHAEGGVDRRGRLLWLAFAFESTTKEGLAYSRAYEQYLKWEAAIQHIKDNVLAPDSPLRSIFQTSEFWTKVMMEVVAVDSAIYGLVLSMVICIISVAVFTGHLALLAIVVVTIMVMICCVVAIFYLAGWEMGAVEAVSLSILVGSSVDYCVHIVEGFVLAGRRMKPTEMKLLTTGALRKLRTSQAVRHIGVAIVCSGLTTILAAVPLTQTTIQPFTKFGSILLINTSVSMLLTLSLATALLAVFGPARFRGTLRSHALAFVLVVALNGLAVLALYIMSRCGVRIPGPSGSPLFG